MTNTLVFVHGAGCTGASFEHQTAYFAQSSAPNLPGHGCAGDAHSVADFSDFMEAYLAEHRLREVILCGHSLGGAIALEVGLRRNDRVRALVVLGSGSRLRVAPAFLEGLRNDFEATTCTLARSMFAAPTAQRVDDVVATMKLAGSQTVRDFEASNAFDVTERLAQLAVPLLAVTGANDVLTPPKYAEFLAGRVPRGQVRIIPGAGHLVMVERSAETNDAIGDFVAKLN